MDLIRAEVARVEHRHGDAWHGMHDISPEHDSAESDVERTWARGRIFRCDSCADEIRIVEGGRLSER